MRAPPVAKCGLHNTRTRLLVIFVAAKALAM
jgi:hypothetical protein